MLRDEAQEVIPSVRIGVIDDDDAGAEAFAGRLAQGQLGQVNGGDGLAAVVENARNPLGAPGGGA